MLRCNTQIQHLRHQLTQTPKFKYVFGILGRQTCLGSYINSTYSGRTQAFAQCLCSCKLYDARL